MPLLYHSRKEEQQEKHQTDDPGGKGEGQQKGDALGDQTDAEHNGDHSPMMFKILAPFLRPAHQVIQGDLVEVGHPDQGGGVRLPFSGFVTAVGDIDHLHGLGSFRLGHVALFPKKAESFW